MLERSDVIRMANTVRRIAQERGLDTDQLAKATNVDAVQLDKIFRGASLVTLNGAEVGKLYGWVDQLAKSGYGMARGFLSGWGMSPTAWTEDMEVTFEIGMGADAWRAKEGRISKKVFEKWDDYEPIDVHARRIAEEEGVTPEQVMERIQVRGWH